MNTTTTDIDAVALLGEPQRHALYRWVTQQPSPVSRDAAAAAVGVSRSLAAFHLDRLADAGLLVVEYRRLSGRTGPGAGRPAKLYSRSLRDVAVSLPDRRYEAAARMLADAVDRAGGSVPPASVRAAARDDGRPIGVAARRAAGARPGQRRRRAALVDTLAARGYEPRPIEGGVIELGNCPYDALVADHRDLVCGMNLAWAGGVLEGLGDDPDGARLDPAEGRCCVVFDPPGGDSGSRPRPS
jgi:predicted ArsR family transcriptional regulator